MPTEPTASLRGLTPVEVSETIVSVDLIEAIANNLLSREVSLSEYINTMLSLIGEVVLKERQAAKREAFETARKEVKKATTAKFPDFDTDKLWIMEEDVDQVFKRLIEGKGEDAGN